MTVWTKESIHHLLDTNPKAVLKACLAIYARQTADEQAANTTTKSNGVGFGAFDAEFCSDIAKRALRAQARDWNFNLTEKQLAVLRNKMKRYHRQLVEIANAKAAAKIEVIAVDNRTAEMLALDEKNMRLIQELERQEEEQRMARKFGVMACECENYDGERLCPSCEMKEAA